jgi:photosystem II stability/assembly factor-like uncharacterized protein
MKKIILVISFLLIISTQTNAQWFWQNPLPTGNRLNDVVYVNDSVGFICGEGVTIFKTIDAGSTWHTIQVNISGELHSIDFVNENCGFAVGTEYIFNDTKELIIKEKMPQRDIKFAN